MAFFEDLQNAGLPVISATEIEGKPKQATFSRSLSDEEAELYHDIRDPSRVTKRQEAAAALLQLKNEYQSALTTLANHETFNTQGMTQAQIVNALVVAVRFHARVLIVILKLLARLVFYI